MVIRENPGLTPRDPREMYPPIRSIPTGKDATTSKGRHPPFVAKKHEREARPFHRSFFSRNLRGNNMD